MYAIAQFAKIVFLNFSLLHDRKTTLNKNMNWEIITLKSTVKRFKEEKIGI